MAVVKSFQAIYKPWKGSHTMPTFALTPDVSLELDEPVARRLYRRLHEHFARQDTRTRDAALLDDNPPLWTRHSGRSGPTPPAWTPPAADLAWALYAPLRGKVTLFFDLLLEVPCRQLTVHA